MPDMRVQRASTSSWPTKNCSKSRAPRQPPVTARGRTQQSRYPFNIDTLSIADYMSAWSLGVLLDIIMLTWGEPGVWMITNFEETNSVIVQPAVGLTVQPKVLALVQARFLWHFPYLERIHGILEGVPTRGRSSVGGPGWLIMLVLDQPLSSCVCTGAIRLCVRSSKVCVNTNTHCAVLMILCRRDSIWITQSLCNQCCGQFG